MNRQVGSRVIRFCVLFSIFLGWLFPGGAASGMVDSEASIPAAVPEAEGSYDPGSMVVKLEQEPVSGGKIHLPVLFTAYPRVNARFGVEMLTISTSDHLVKVVESGAQWVRRNGLRWMVAEPSEGVFDWNAPHIKGIEAELINARASGLDPILVVRTTPAWARLGVVEVTPGGEKFDFSPYLCGPVRPDKYAAFGNFMYEVVKRYSVYPYNVRHFQIGNEPEGEAAAVGEGGLYYGCWGWSKRPYFNGESYGDMLSAVYPRIKQANPQAQVVFGGLLLDCNPADNPDNCKSRAVDFFEGAIYRNGKRDGHLYFDAVAYHGYDIYMEKLGQYGHPGWSSWWNTTGPVLLAKGNFLKNVLNQYGAGDKTIMNTEGAIMCGKGGVTPYCLESDFQLTKAYYVPEYFVVASSLGLKTSIWYGTTGWRYSNLVNADGSPTLAYHSFKFAIKKLDSAVFSQVLTQYPGVFAYEFQEGSRTIWFVWSKDGNPHTITLPKTPGSIWDALGTPQAVTGTSVTVTVKPLYIEW